MSRPPPPTIYLTGMMGVGKSTVGRLLAFRAGRLFVDTDARVEAEAGRTVREVFAREGEAAFRRREAAALAETDGEVALVVAVGGGAVLSEANRALMRRTGEVVWLTGDPALLADRVRRATTRPLLDDGDPEELLAELLAARRSAYADCDRRIDVTSRTPEEVVDVVLQRPLQAYHGEREYPVYVTEAGPEAAAEPLREALASAGRVLVVADRRADELHGEALGRALTDAGLRRAIVRVDASEEGKSLGAADRLWHQMARLRVDRDVPVLAFGGGVTSDLAGFAAATWKRGVPWAPVATTLLAMVDAAVGGKTGVNLPEGKNLVGAFHPPALAFLPTACLATLPDRELASGLAEAVKSALVGDEALFGLLERERDGILSRDRSLLADVVRRSVAVKVAVVATDPEERTGARRSLNLGHTAAHAIEAEAGYTGVTHGEAVALGIVLAARVAVEEGCLADRDAARVEAVLAGLGLPTDTGRWAAGGVEAWRAALSQDKKRLGGVIRYVVPQGLGGVRELELAPDELVARLGRAAARKTGGA